MNFSLTITGPNFAHEAVIVPSEVDLILGRDSSADIVLSDPEKCISRRHVAVRAARDGVQLRVVSTVNGVETSRGAVDRGQSIGLTDGDYFTVGPYRVDVLGREVEPQTPTALVSSPSRSSVAFDDDPFAALLGQHKPEASGDDPFSSPDFQSAPAMSERSARDPFSELASITGARPIQDADPARPSPSAGNFGQSGHGPDVAASRHGLTPAAATTRPGAQLNNWLSGGVGGDPMQGAANSGPLDAFLGRSAAAPARALSPDHVHGINMPFSFGHVLKSGPALISSAPDLPIPSQTSTQAQLEKGRTNFQQELSQPWVTEQSASSDAHTVSLPATPHSAPFEDELFEDGAASLKEDVFAEWPDVSAPDSRIVNSAIFEPGAVPKPNPEFSGTPDQPTELRVSPGTAGPAESTADRPWAAFGRGLGLPASYPSDDQTAERAGMIVRELVEGLADLLAARAELRRELRAADRTMLSGRDNNPLKFKLSSVEMIQYLFAVQTAGGYMPAERAVRESVAELRMHEHATLVASRAAVEGALRDFEPGRLRKQLANEKSGLFQILDKAKLWEAYQRDYEKKSQNMADWLEAVFNSHFMPAYSRETERLKMGKDASPPT